MIEEELLKLAQDIHDGRATEQEKLQFFKALNFELGEISEILKKAPRKK